MLWIGKACRAGRSKKLRHFLSVEVFLASCIGSCAEDLEGQQNLVAFDELTHLLDSLCGVIAVAVGQQRDFAFCAVAPVATIVRSANKMAAVIHFHRNVMKIFAHFCCLLLRYAHTM